MKPNKFSSDIKSRVLSHTQSVLLTHNSSSVKSLSLSLRSSGGRNATGRITSFHRGGGHKQRYRLLDWGRQLTSPALVRRLQHDPNRNCYVALLAYRSGELAYILAPEGLRQGDVVMSNEPSALMLATALPLRDLPLGSTVHNLQLAISAQRSYVRAAGTSAQLLKKSPVAALLKLPSGRRISLPLHYKATLGRVSNSSIYFRRLFKAGRSRWMGRRPVVRGVAMNPVDHPMGGKTHGKVHRTPWGRVTKGPRTARRKR